MACPEDLNKIWDTLKQVSAKQKSYEERYLAVVDNKASTTGSSISAQTKFSVASDVTAQGSHLQEISDLIAHIKAKVEELFARFTKTELAIDSSGAIWSFKLSDYSWFSLFKTRKTTGELTS